MASARILDRSRLDRLMTDELAAFERANPRSRDLFERAKGSLLDGVPMNWMVKWAGRVPAVRGVGVRGAVHRRRRPRVRGLLPGRHRRDGRPRPRGHAARRRAPAAPRNHPHAPDRGRHRRRARSSAAGSGCRYWQFTLTATDANRFAIRLARHITGRSRILVHNHCYHGSVDETFAVIGTDGGVVDRARQHRRAGTRSRRRRGWSISTTSRALERALAKGDVAACLFEPALTNVGIVLPEPGYHEGVRELTRRYGTLLINDETHTICAGPGGYTGLQGLQPDFLTIGKTIGGGIPAGAYGFTEDVAAGISARSRARTPTSAGSAARSPATRCRWRRSGQPWRGADRARRSRG